MRAEKRRNDIERLLAMELAENVQNLHFALPIESVTALGFERGGAVRGEFAEKARALRSFSACRGCAAQAFNRRANSAAASRDFFVSFSGDALLVFVGAALREKSGECANRRNREGPRVRRDRVFRARRASRRRSMRAARADGGDAIAANQQRAIANDAEIAQGLVRVEERRRAE